MNHSYKRPHQSLSKLVRSILVLENDDASKNKNLPIFANGMSTLICKTEKGESEHECIVQLQLSSKEIPADVWTMNNNTTLIIYLFKPFAATTLFKVTAKKLLETPIELGSWNAHKTNALRTQLSYATTTTRKLEILDNLLLKQLEENIKTCETVQYATDEIMNNSDPEILANIQSHLGLNERTFQRIFKKYVGITPSQYRRICQFQISFEQIKGQQFESLTDVAYDNGFADQSHFNRSFKEFTNTTPNSYLRAGLKGKK